jgi:hypothetical protein
LNSLYIIVWASVTTEISSEAKYVRQEHPQSEDEAEGSAKDDSNHAIGCEFLSGFTFEATLTFSGVTSQTA